MAEISCPQCEVSLSPEQYEGVELDKCESCHGVWLDSGELTKIVESRDMPIPASVVDETLALAFAGIPRDEARRLVRCPRCGAAMSAVNYDYSSGVIVDRCPQNHGTWLDGGEIEKIQAHHEEWEQRSEELQSDWLGFAEAVLNNKAPIEEEARRREMRPTRYLVNSVIRKALGG